MADVAGDSRRWVVNPSVHPAFTPGVDPPAGVEGPALWFACQSGTLLVSSRGDATALPYSVDLAPFGLEPVRRQFLGTLNGRPCFSADVPTGASLPEGWSFQGLRSLFSVFGEDYFRIAGRASQIVDWGRDHRFCGRCATPTVEKPGERVKECPSCGLFAYPRISPAVIAAVVRDGKILLAHAARFPSGLFSVLAGFVDAGETLEECIHREVREEAGIEIRNLRYFSSQPWPFPNSLMIAFIAEHSSGEIVIDGREIDEAAWHAPHALPRRIPDRISVARKLIDWFVDTHGGPSAGRSS
jgi:NAD+ diphosphatase